MFSVYSKQFALRAYDYSGKTELCYAAVSMPVSRLRDCRDRAGWSIGDNAQAANAAEDMAELLEIHLLPNLDKFGTVQLLIELLETDGPLYVDARPEAIEKRLSRYRRA